MEKEQNEEKKPREREANWSTAEKEYLRECINMHLDIVEHKGNDTSMILKKKNTWKDIRAAMASAGYDRDVSKLKSQWVRMKVSARKAVASMKRASIATGNSVAIPQISSEDNLVQSMLVKEFVEDEILIDSDCVNEHRLVESPILAEYLDCEVLNDESNNQKGSSGNIKISPESPQVCTVSSFTTPLKSCDDIKKQKCSSSKLHRLRNLPKTPSKNNIILERQNQIVKESLCYEEVTNLQKEKLKAEIQNIMQEKELNFLKLQRLQRQMEHDEELHDLKMEILRKKTGRNHNDLFDF